MSERISTRSRLTLNMEPRKGNNNWIGVVIILLIVGGALFFVSRHKAPGMADTPPPAVSQVSVKDLSLFRDGLAAGGIAADQIGFHSFSPDGKWFFFTIFKQGASPANQAYLMSTSDGITTKLSGTAERGIEDSRVIQLATTGGINLYFTATRESKNYKVGTNATSGSLSPDGKTYVVNTTSGIKKIDIASGLVASFTKNQYDGAYAWFADSNRMLGFKETDEVLSDGAGKARIIGIWDMATTDFVPLVTNITDKTVRSVAWIVPDKVARINTGFDDGSHDYLLNVENNAVVDIGDTSGALMGGVKVDSTRGLFVVVGGDDQSTIGSTVLMYKGMMKLYELTLPKGYFRQSVQIVDANRLIYLRKQMGENGTTAQALVSLDLRTGTETLLQELPAKAFTTALSLSADHKTWVLSNGALFVTGTI